MAQWSGPTGRLQAGDNALRTLSVIAAAAAVAERLIVSMSLRPLNGGANGMT